MHYAQLPEDLRKSVDDVLIQLNNVLRAHANEVSDDTKALLVTALRYALSALVLEAFSLGHRLCEEAIRCEHEDETFH